jgi:hypothetical protein
VTESQSTPPGVARTIFECLVVHVRSNAICLNHFAVTS